MFSSRPTYRRLAPPSVTPLASVFSDNLNRCHPFGDLLAVLSTIGGVILVLAVSI